IKIIRHAIGEEEIFINGKPVINEWTEVLYTIESKDNQKRTSSPIILTWWYIGRLNSSNSATRMHAIQALVNKGALKINFLEVKRYIRGIGQELIKAETINNTEAEEYINLSDNDIWGIIALLGRFLNTYAYLPLNILKDSIGTHYVPKDKGGHRCINHWEGNCYDAPYVPSSITVYVKWVELEKNINEEITKLKIRELEVETKQRIASETVVIYPQTSSDDLPIYGTRAEYAAYWGKDYDTGLSIEDQTASDKFEPSHSEFKLSSSPIDLSFIVVLIGVYIVWKLLKSGYNFISGRSKSYLYTSTINPPLDIDRYSITIGSFSSEFRGDILELWKNHFFYEVHGREPNMSDFLVVQRVLSGQIPQTIWCAFSAGKVIGFIALDPPETNFGCSTVEVIAVHRGYRGRGIASMLFKHAVDEAKHNPHTSMILIEDSSLQGQTKKLALGAGFEYAGRGKYVFDNNSKGSSPIDEQALLAEIRQKAEQVTEEKDSKQENTKFNRVRWLQEKVGLGGMSRIKGGLSLEVPVQVEIHPYSILQPKPCNNNCIWCTRGSDKQHLIDSQEIGIYPDSLIRFIQGFQGVGISEFALAGNSTEPLLYPEIEEVIKAIKGIGSSLRLYSNFYYGEKAVNAAKYLSQGDIIRVSLDSGRESSYALTHRPEDKFAFKKILSNVSALLELKKSRDLKFEVVITYLLNSINSSDEELRFIISWAAFNGVNAIRFIRPLTPWGHKTNFYPLTLAALESTKKVISSLSAEFGNNNTNIIFNPVYTEQDAKNFQKCHYWKIAAILGSRGKFFPCTSTATEKYKNILGRSDINSKGFNFWNFWSDRNKWAGIDLCNCEDCTRAEFEFNSVVDQYIRASSPIKEGSEEIYSNFGVLAALAINSNIPLSDKFTPLTNDPSLALQMAINQGKKGDKGAKVHYHTPAEGQNVPRSEIILVLEGSIKALAYTTEGVLVKEVVLNKGEAILFIQAHTIEFLEDSRLLEIKQGPYPGPDKDKVVLDNIIQSSSSPITDSDLRAQAEEAISAWKDAFTGRSAELEYLYNIYLRYLKGARSYRIGKDLANGENFIPSALLTEEERRTYLGAVDYADLAAQDLTQRYSEAAKDVDMVANPLDGGLGAAVARKKYLNNRAQTEPEIASRARDARGDIKLGAKGTDLAFDVTVNGITYKISVAEIKLLRLLSEASYYASTTYQPLISDDSKPSYEALLNKPCFFDPSKTYRQALAERGISLSDMEQFNTRSIPTADPDTKKLQDKKTTGGGHGQLGMMFLLRTLTEKIVDNTKSYIRAFFNGDGINNAPNRIIAGWMHKKNIPIVMITTTKTGIDKKGGQIGLEVFPDGSMAAGILELAQVPKDQKETFYEMGITEGAPHAQYFNTNIALINYSILAPFIQELASII
ncbi:MAG: UTP--glucose-1-phosphate uridylyltransferase, partial [Candidatus Omnitrophica bacterium]|nr:UTP--glucose-1-phosphate uridylyltransferase [Candidatus Omnitrophota bacterium]